MWNKRIDGGMRITSGATTDREAIVRAILRARWSGRTLRDASVLAGVHVATVCRWQRRDPDLRRKLQEAADINRDDAEPEPRRRVPWHRDCPLCKARVVVRTAR